MYKQFQFVLDYCIKGSLECYRSILCLLLWKYLVHQTALWHQISLQIESFEMTFQGCHHSLIRLLGNGPFTPTIISLRAVSSLALLNLLKWISNFEVSDSITDSTNIFTADSQMQCTTILISLFNSFFLQE